MPSCAKFVFPLWGLGNAGILFIGAPLARPTATWPQAVGRYAPTGADMRVGLGTGYGLVLIELCSFGFLCE